MSELKDLLAVENLSVTRGGTPVLRHVSWRMLPGERWVIMGANGSGKTSLLSVLTGLLVPTEGSVQVLGNVYGVDDWSHLKKVVSLVSSSLRQLVQDEETALEVIASGRYGQLNFWGRLTAEDKAAAGKIARLVRAEPILARPWAVLSQGERQRVLIGRALIAQPQLLILDEPCAGLDPAAREQFLVFLDHLASQAKGPAIVLVTHHVEEITPAFSHVLGLKDGRVLMAAPKAETLQSDVLSRLFSAPVEISRHHGHYELKVVARRGRAM
jgi:iron complex transport system ATP-binding protein